jgi:hypothetical protein
MIAAAKAHPVATALAIVAVTVAILIAAHNPANEPMPHAADPGAPAVVTARAPSPPVGPVVAGQSGVPPKSHTRARHAASPARRFWPEAAQDAARSFLATYVPFTYAQLAANKIRADDEQLQAHIAANPPEVPAWVHRLHPKVSTLAIIPARLADAGAGWAATVTVTDGMESYQVSVKIAPRPQRWLVTSILTP